MKEGKLMTVIWIILVSLAALTVIATMIMLDEHEKMTQMPCEELIQQKATSSGYAPLPKRCMKGE